MNKDFRPANLKDATSVACMLQRYYTRCNPRDTLIYRSESANTNSVFLIAGCDGKPLFVLRVCGSQNHGMVQVEHRKIHENFEFSVLQYLRANECTIAPQPLKNDEGLFGWSNDSGARVTAFSVLPGNLIGSFDDLTRFDQLRRRTFFKQIGRMSYALSAYINMPISGELSLCEMNDEAEARFESVMRELAKPSHCEAKKLVEPFERSLRIFLRKLMNRKYLFEKICSQACHFDLHLGNVLFDEISVSAVLDWDWSRSAEWYGVDWAASIAMCCATYDHSGGAADGVYDQRLIDEALAALRTEFGSDARLDLQTERELLNLTIRSYLFAQFLFTCFQYLEAPSVEARFVDMRHFLYLIVKNDFDALFSG